MPVFANLAGRQRQVSWAASLVLNGALVMLAVVWAGGGVASLHAPVADQRPAVTVELMLAAVERPSTTARESTSSRMQGRPAPTVRARRAAAAGGRAPAPADAAEAVPGDALAGPPGDGEGSSASAMLPPGALQGILGAIQCEDLGQRLRDACRDAGGGVKRPGEIDWRSSDLTRYARLFGTSPAFHMGGPDHDRDGGSLPSPLYRNGPDRGGAAGLGGASEMNGRLPPIHPDPAFKD